MMEGTVEFNSALDW